jgi:methylated-DNA-[protein]-cysteine S-methyltransferase
MAKKTDEPLTYAIWATAWGPMGAVASAAGLRRIVLPHYQPGELAQLFAWEHPGAVRDDGPFERLMALTRQYYNARPTDFVEIACDLPPEGTFSGKVLRACRTIGFGQTCTYSLLAGKIGSPDSARAVGTALGKNPIPLVVPCHRVVNAFGGMSGFSAPGGIDVKKRMLEMEKKAKSEERIATSE